MSCSFLLSLRARIRIVFYFTIDTHRPGQAIPGQDLFLFQMTGVCESPLGRANRAPFLATCYSWRKREVFIKSPTWHQRAVVEHQYFHAISLLCRGQLYYSNPPFPTSSGWKRDRSDRCTTRSDLRSGPQRGLYCRVLWFSDAMSDLFGNRFPIGIHDAAVGDHEVHEVSVVPMLLAADIRLDTRLDFVGK